MARPEKDRRISQPPIMKGFKPFGIPRCNVETINFVKIGTDVENVMVWLKALKTTIQQIINLMIST